MADVHQRQAVADAAITRATQVSIAAAMTASKVTSSTGAPFSRAKISSTTGWLRGRLPTWVVRMRHTVRGTSYKL